MVTAVAVIKTVDEVNLLMWIVVPKECWCDVSRR